MTKRVKKKPTIKEITNVLIELNDRTNSLMRFLSELEKAFSLYVEMNKDDKRFTKYIDKKVKELKKAENDTRTNGDIDGDNLPRNKEDERSRPERVRQATS